MIEEQEPARQAARTIEPDEIHNYIKLACKSPKKYLEL